MAGIRHVMEGIFLRQGRLIISNWEIPQFYDKLACCYKFDFEPLVLLNEKDSHEAIVQKYLEKVPFPNGREQSPCLFMSDLTYLHGFRLPIRTITEAAKRKNPPEQLFCRGGP
jgi:hypothetical protein